MNISYIQVKWICTLKPFTSRPFLKRNLNPLFSWQPRWGDIKTQPFCTSLDWQDEQSKCCMCWYNKALTSFLFGLLRAELDTELNHTKPLSHILFVWTPMSAFSEATFWEFCQLELREQQVGQKMTELIPAGLVANYKYTNIRGWINRVIITQQRAPGGGGGGWKSPHTHTPTIQDMPWDLSALLRQTYCVCMCVYCGCCKLNRGQWDPASFWSSSVPVSSKLWPRI